MLDLRSLEAFYWVARLGGFRRAAARLNTTQPAVSARIADLEARLGVRLFDRTRQTTRLTARGQDLMVYAERLLALSAELVQAMTDPGRLSGRVRLGVSETIVQIWLAQLVKALHERYPQITLDITVDISPHLRDRLLDGTLDVALLLGPISAPAVKNRPLGDYPLVWVAAPALDLPDRPLSLADLVPWPIITYDRATRPYHELAELFSRALPPVRLFANSSLSSILRMTLDGIGIGAIPAAVAAPEIAAGRLRQLTVERDLPTLTFTASYTDPPDRPLNAIVAGLAESIAADHQS